MLISNEWLKDYVNVDQSVQALAERITRTGIEVDDLSLIHISEPTRQCCTSRMPSSA